MAGRYALALFALAQEQNALDQVVADLEGFNSC
jgi:F0F1-type ATP synthase delta subunit